jgi:hypothetical protein
MPVKFQFLFSSCTSQIFQFNWAALSSVHCGKILLNSDSDLLPTTSTRQRTSDSCNFKIEGLKIVLLNDDYLTHALF